MYANLGYPTKKQEHIWLQRRNDQSTIDIAKKLKISSPMVSKAYRIALSRIEKLLRHTASTFRVDIDHLSSEFGFAVGHCSPSEELTYITYTPELGVQTWFSHFGDCNGCDSNKRCNSYLDSLARFWQVSLDHTLPPTEKGLKLFQNIMGSLGWDEVGGST
ncbi:MAG: hypothetical protein ACW99U_15145 [Candidatus Thorarchaeota archaeon]|jgi:hypothetical protein